MSGTGTGTDVGGSGGVAAGTVMRVEIEIGHLAVIGAGGNCAEISAEWCGRWLEGWKEEEGIVRKRGCRKSESEMLVVSEEWKDLMKKDPRSLRPTREKL